MIIIFCFLVYIKCNPAVNPYLNQRTTSVKFTLYFFFLLTTVKITCKISIHPIAANIKVNPLLCRQIKIGATSVCINFNVFAYIIKLHMKAAAAG